MAKFCPWRHLHIWRNYLFMTDILRAISDPANWRIMPMWSNCIKSEHFVWVGDPRIMELAKKA